MAWPYLRATSGCALLKEITSESDFTVCTGIVELDALVPGPKSLLARYALRSRLKPKSSTVEQGGIVPTGVALRAATSAAVTQVPYLLSTFCEGISKVSTVAPSDCMTAIASFISLVRAAPRPNSIQYGCMGTAMCAPWSA